MAGSFLGNRVLRTEDPRFLTGEGTYIQNLDLPNQLHAVFVRSPIAHAEITSIETGAAAAMPGVAAVYTSDQLGVKAHHGFVKVNDAFARTPLANGRVRFVGEMVVMILADTFQHAIDAAEMVEIDYEPLDVTVDPEAALGPEASVIFDAKGNNVATTLLDPPQDVLAGADIVVRGKYYNQRVAGVPMEPNSAAAIPGADGAMTFYAATQMPHVLKAQMADALDMEADKLRIIAPDVGGGFGAKAGLYPEFTALAAAAALLGRPATWTETRSENMVALVHSRAQVQWGELGMTADGDFTGLHLRVIVDSGAYPNIGAMLPTFSRLMASGTYDLPMVRFDAISSITNTTPTGAYRGAGRPEATSLIERLVDQAARETGHDPIELRKRNFIKPEQFPFTTKVGTPYDTGEYAMTLDKVVEISDYASLRAEQTERLARGDRKVLGIGIASYVEITSGRGGSEYGSIEVNDDGSATIMAGTSGHGQGHETTFAMIVAEQTGIPVERITLVQSDTDLVRSGGGTGGSRSLQMGGSAVKAATEAMIEKAKSLAGHVLESSTDDIVIDVTTGSVGVAGVPAKALSWGELASAARADDLPTGVLDTSDGMEGLAAQLDQKQEAGTYPFGSHIAVVEVDLDTGAVEQLRHFAVDDAGNVINPLIFEGQQHGGIAQGASQALYEEVAFDEDGNPITANLMDYAMPSAAEMPSFDAIFTETPTHMNALGVKGVGEAGTIGSTPAVQNAVIDAVAHLGVTHIDMPCSNERVWQAIQQAAAGDFPAPWQDPPAIFAELEPEPMDPDELAKADAI